MGLGDDYGTVGNPYNLDAAGTSRGVKAGSISKQGGSSSYAGYAAAIQTASAVAQGFAETDAFKAQLDFNFESAMQNAGNAMTSFELQQVKNAEQINNINHVLGDKLSERGLIAMKEEALLRTAAAETGTSGGTTAMAIKEAFITENMDRANIISASNATKRNVFMSMDTAQVQIQNKIDSILLGGTAVGTNSIAAGMAGGLNVMNQTLSMIPMSERSKAFGIAPTKG